VTQGTHPLPFHGFFPYPASQPKDGAIPRDKRREARKEYRNSKRERKRDRWRETK